MCFSNIIFSVFPSFSYSINSQVVPVVSSTLISLMIVHEHMCDTTANLCSILYSRCQQNTDLMNDLIVEVSKQNFSETAKTSSLIKNLSRFIVDLRFESHL